ncbi:MAG: hypothetical protein K2X87_17775, partial [Gemmataceae bacterium]|nr:hypothetical protein [Gemmataceae bacterium]
MPRILPCDPKCEQFWRRTLARFGSSGSNVRDFCRRQLAGRDRHLVSAVEGRRPRPAADANHSSATPAQRPVVWRRAGSLFVFLLPLSARAADQPAPDLPRYAAARLDGGRFLADRVVHGAALSPDGRRLVVRTVDRCFVLDAATGRR